MTEVQLEKAALQEISWTEDQQTQEVGDPIPVQFNPESLKLAYANQNASGDQRGGSAIQYVGSGSTKLSFDLWLDVTSAHHTTDVGVPQDVRELTAKILHFITPKKEGDKFIPPGVRFQWGSFLFEGVMDSLNESLEYFSEQGVPLRAKVSVSLSKQEIKFERGEQQAGGGLGTFSSGRPRQEAKQDDTVADMADRAGQGRKWPQIASANGIENPRSVPPGTLLDTRPGTAPGLGSSLPGGRTPATFSDLGSSPTGAAGRATSRAGAAFSARLRRRNQP